MIAASGQYRLVLPKGVTGFRDHRSEPLPLIDPRLFRGVSHHVAVLLEGRVESITTEVGVTPNFYTSLITYGERRILLLGHHHLPLLATAPAPAQGGGPSEFADEHRLHEVPEHLAPFRLLTQAELQTPVHLIDLTELNRAELTQIRSWKPETAGEIIFNYWD